MPLRSHFNTPTICVWPREEPRLHDANELDLITRLHARDETAFHEIVDRYMSKIYRAAFGIVRSRAAADEIAQEVFVKVYSSIPVFAGRTCLYPWIYRIAVSECYAYLLKQRCTPSADRPARSDQDVRRTFINEILANVPEDDRWLLISKDVDGSSLSELSQISGLSEQTIKGRLLKTRQYLVAAVAGARRR